MVFISGPTLLHFRGFSVYTCDVSIVSRSERGRKINAVVDQAGKAMTDTTKAVGTCVAM